MSFAPRFTITNQVTAALTRIERARGFLEARTLQRDLRAMVEKGLLATEGQTNRLEYVAGEGLT